MLNKNTKRQVFGFLSGWLAPPLLRGLAWSQTYRVSGENSLFDLARRDTNFILAFWHGQMLPVLFYFTRSDFDQSTFHTFISPHRDGEYITRAAGGLGINALRTSLRDRKLRALKQIHGVIENGGNLAVTPDGPIGPRFEAKEGIVKLSRRFDLPVLPVAALPESGKYFSSWDKLCLPYPFGRVQICFGEPQRFNEDRSLNEGVRSVEETLLSLTERVMETVTTPEGYLNEA